MLPAWEMRKSAHALQSPKQGTTAGKASKRKSKAVAGHGRTHQAKMDVSALLSPSVEYNPDLMPITMMIVYSALIALIESSVAQLNHLHVSTTNRHGVS